MPLGTILTSKEDENTVKAGFDLYKSILPPDAFFHRGEKGPKIAMTDDSKAEQNALQEVWQDITLLLCVFHLLQALWRWEWNADHKIDKSDRPALFNLFKSLVYAQTSSDYETRKNELLSHKTAHKYPQFLEHVKNDILPRKSEWALSERIEKKLSTHNINTTNYVEVSFRLTKDNQFNRVRCYNLVDLLDMILDDSSYYVMRCLDVSGNRTSQLKNQKSRYLSKKCQIDPTNIEKIDENLYMVPSEQHFQEFKKMYMVNMNLSICECPVGILHGPCKHKQIVAEHFKIASPDVIPHENPQVRALYYYLATGERKSMTWFRSLKDTESNETESPAIFSSMITTSDTIIDDFNVEISNEGTVQDESDVELEMVEEVREDFINSIDYFKEEVLRRMDDDPNTFTKCVKKLNVQLQTINTLNDSSFCKTLFSFGEKKFLPVKVGRKKQKKNINIQSTSKSRRIYQFRGKKTAPKGRPRKTVVKRKRNEEQSVYHALPSGKKRKIKHPHSISAAVESNRAAERKH